MTSPHPRADRAARALAWILAGSVIAQFYTAGLGIFGGASFQAHRVLGSAAALVALLLLVWTLIARRGGRASLYAVVCLVFTVLQPVLVFVVRPRSPELAAVHPVVGILIGVLAWRLASSSAGQTRPWPQVSLQE